MFHGLPLSESSSAEAKKTQTEQIRGFFSSCIRAGFGSGKPPSPRGFDATLGAL
jgi:hypothetical protein